MTLEQALVLLCFALPSSERHYHPVEPERESSPARGVSPCRRSPTPTPADGVARSPPPSRPPSPVTTPTPSPVREDGGDLAERGPGAPHPPRISSPSVCPPPQIFEAAPASISPPAPAPNLPVFSAREVASATRLPLDEVQRALVALSTGARPVLVSIRRPTDCDEAEADTLYALNVSCTWAGCGKRVKVIRLAGDHTRLRDDEQVATQALCEAERRWVTQAALARVLKLRRSVSFSELCTLVARRLATFRPDIRLIKEALQKLVNDGVATRDADDHDVIKFGLANSFTSCLHDSSLFSCLFSSRSTLTALTYVQCRARVLLPSLHLSNATSSIYPIKDMALLRRSGSV